MVGTGPAHTTSPVAALADQLPGWASLVRAPNPGPMTLDGTNTWVLRAPGAEGAVVVDPGPCDEGHLAAVAAAGPVRLIIATHGHPDHVEGLDRFRELSPDAVVVAPSDGAVLAECGLVIRLLATPGHTADSICLVVSLADGGQPAVLSGDTILGRGTTVVAYPDGDLGAYLSSLRALAGLGSIPVLPGHGPVLADCSVAAGYYLAHRRARLDQVRAVLAAGVTTPAEVVATVYQDVDRELWPAAEWSVRAQLAYLADEESAGPGPEGPENSPVGRESSSGPVGLDTP
jgi:glyoxylase-like metal-dependent hydrolase (beta-lactamase superfamily II)